MIPIPKRLLIHDAVLKIPLSEDEYGEVTYSEPHTLKRVRLESAKSVVISKDGRQVQLAAVLIYDAKVSNGKPMEDFAAGQAIEWAGQGYTVNRVERLYDGGKLHHYELGLV